jgi:hypothetical protein
MAVKSFDSSTNFYETTWRNISEDIHFHTCRRESEIRYFG